MIARRLKTYRYKMKIMNKNFVQKVEEAADLATGSIAMREVLSLKYEQWIAVFAELDEKKIDELLFVLKEEMDGYKEIEKKRQRRHAINKTRYFHRLERLKIDMAKIKSKFNV